MPGKRWTLLFVSPEGQGLRQVSLGAKTLKRLTVGAGLFVIALVVLAGYLTYQGYDAARAIQLEREKGILIEELAAIRDRVSDLEGELSALAEMDAELRILAGLDTIDEEVLRMGVGGPGSPSLESHPLYQTDPDAGTQAFTVAYDLNALERRARLLRESIVEASDSLIAHRDLLESTPSLLPTSGFLTSGFSRARLHPIHNRALPHEGVDIAAPRGTPILAAANGRISFAGRRTGYGLTVEIDHGYGYSTLYGHADKILVRVGQMVERGEVVAQVGNTGIATSPHLHYEVRIGGVPVNPLNYVITGAVP
jgi:murein DD-endopeptidase MepM/ murein hydrolase activator NlpD